MQDMSEQLYDIYTQWHVPFWQKNYFLIAIGVVAVISVGILLWYFLARVFRKRKVVPYPVATRNELTQLQASEYANVQQAHFFYAALIRIIKKYLTLHYSRDFTSKTDRECLDELMRAAHNKQINDLVAHILNGSLAVRFAQAHVAQQMIHDDLDRAFQIVSISQVDNMSNQQ